MDAPDCGCDHDNGYYNIDGVAECAPCHHKCKSCSDYEVCIDCATGRTEGSEPDCPCPDG